MVEYCHIAMPFGSRGRMAQWAVHGRTLQPTLLPFLIHSQPTTLVHGRTINPILYSTTQRPFFVDSQAERRENYGSILDSETNTTKMVPFDLEESNFHIFKTKNT